MAALSRMEVAIAQAAYTSPEEHITQAMATTHIGTIDIQGMVLSPIPAAQVTAGVTTGTQLMVV